RGAGEHPQQERGAERAGDDPGGQLGGAEEVLAGDVGDQHDHGTDHGGEREAGAAGDHAGQRPGEEGHEGERPGDRDGERAEGDGHEDQRHPGARHGQAQAGGGVVAQLQDPQAHHEQGEGGDQHQQRGGEHGGAVPGGGGQRADHPVHRVPGGVQGEAGEQAGDQSGEGGGEGDAHQDEAGGHGAGGTRAARPRTAQAPSSSSAAVPSPPSSANQNRARPSAWKNAIAMTAPAEAPTVTPITSGLARGLRSRVWNVVPESPKAVPASTATTATGSRWSMTMKEMPGTFTPLSARRARSTGTIGVTTSTRTASRASSSSAA